MDFWGVVLIVGGVIVGIWLVWKLIGGIANLALSGHDRRLRESPQGVAIATLAARSGANDGSPQSKEKAARFFADLLRHSPFDLDLDDLTIDEVIEGYSIAVRTSQFPIAVEAAYAVTGGSSYEEVEHWSKSDVGVALASAFVALFPKWPSRHRTSSLEVARMERGRWAMIMVLLEERAQRDGLLQ
ncbi:hypothetical protein ACQ143_13185 [Microbacterium sp. MC2]